MDSEAKRSFRSKLAAQKRERRIDSPLVRYNEYDQPLCRICNVPLKSESLWPAHQASRKHHEAIESVRAAASGQTRGSNTKLEPPNELLKPRSASTLPADFFENPEKKRPRNDIGTSSSVSASSNIHEKKEESHVNHSFKVPQSVTRSSEQSDVHGRETNERSNGRPSTKLRDPSKKMDSANTKRVKGPLPENFFDDIKSESDNFSQMNHTPGMEGSVVNQSMGAPGDTDDSKGRTENTHSGKHTQPSERMDGFDANQVKGALPEGFFDNKDADLRARGIEPVKIDINDAYKEFEKDIQEDLQEVDDRLGEEEIDAAEVREEFDSLEQKAFREQVEMVKKRLMEVKVARLSKEKKAPAFMGKESSDESSSDEDEDDDDDFAVDWRAKHF